MSGPSPLRPARVHGEAGLPGGLRVGGVPRGIHQYNILPHQHHQDTHAGGHRGHIVIVRWNLASNILLLAFGIKYFLPENAWRRVHEFPVSVQVVITGAGGAGHVPGGARQLHEELHVLGHHQHDLRIPAAAAADRGQAIGCDCDSEKRWYTTHVGDT